MKVREASPKDFSVLAGLLDEIKTTDQPQSQFNWSSRNLLDELSNCRTFVVGDRESIFSFLCVRENLDFFEITVLATLPEKRNQGFQSALLKELLSLARATVKPILLEVHEENFSAIRLYKQLGFREISKRKSYYADGKSALIFQYAPWLLLKA